MESCQFVSRTIDSIYEAAFDPKRLQNTLSNLTSCSGSTATGMAVFDGTTSFGLMDRFNARRSGLGFWQKSESWHRSLVKYAKDNPLTVFSPPDRYFSKSVFDPRELQEELIYNGIGAQLGTTMVLPNKYTVVYVCEKSAASEAYSLDSIAKLNTVRPHLARAALLSGNLGMQRAAGTVAMLNAIGLPAAMLSLNGKVLETNELMAQASENVRPVAWGMLRLTQTGADRQLQQIIAEMRAGVAPRAKSIPVSSGNDRQLVHVIPISGSTRNLFYEARLLLVITKISAAALVPSREILTQLYELTEAEARLARILASGQSLQDCAQLLGISYGTVRSYLLRIFRKTETNQQSELVALLKSVGQIGVVV